MTWLVAFKAIFSIGLMILMVFEWRNFKGNPSTALGSFVMMSIVLSYNPWLSKLYVLIIMLVWVAADRGKFDRFLKFDKGAIFYYIFPIFGHLISYILGWVMLYGANVVPYVAIATNRVASLFVLSLLVYMAFNAKHMILRFKGVKHNNEGKFSNVMPFMFIAYMALILM